MPGTQQTLEKQWPVLLLLLPPLNLLKMFTHRESICSRFPDSLINFQQTLYNKRLHPELIIPKVGDK